MPRYSRIEPEWLDTAAVMTLGGDSRTTFHRRRTNDPSFPKPTHRGRRPFWLADAIRTYYAALAEREIDAGPSDALREARDRLQPVRIDAESDLGVRHAPPSHGGGWRARATRRDGPLLPDSAPWAP